MPIPPPAVLESSNSWPFDQETLEGLNRSRIRTRRVLYREEAVMFNMIRAMMIHGGIVGVMILRLHLGLRDTGEGFFWRKSCVKIFLLKAEGLGKKSWVNGCLGKLITYSGILLFQWIGAAFLCKLAQPCQLLAVASRGSVSVVV